MYRIAPAEIMRVALATVYRNFESRTPMKPCYPIGRRGFLRGAASLPTLALFSTSGETQERPALPARTAKFNGIQMGPHTILDEGIERSLDLIQGTAAINAILVYSHTYHGDIQKAPQLLATDHGVTPRDMRNRKLPWVWVMTHEQYYRGNLLRHQKVDASYEMPAAICSLSWWSPAGSEASSSTPAFWKARDARWRGLWKGSRK